MVWLAVVTALLLGELRWLLAIQTVLARVSSLQNRTLALRVQHQEYAAVQETKAQMALVQGVAEQLIDSTTQTTRETHQRIADVPFSVFESIPATRDAAKAARGVHDITSTGVYAAVSLLNKGVGKGLRGIMQTDVVQSEKQGGSERPGLENPAVADSDKPGDDKS